MGNLSRSMDKKPQPIRVSKNLKSINGTIPNKDHVYAITNDTMTHGKRKRKKK